MLPLAARDRQCDRSSPHPTYPPAPPASDGLCKLPPFGGEQKAERKGIRTKALFKPLHANISKKLLTETIISLQESMHFNSYEDIRLLPFLRGVETRLTQRVSLAWRQTRQFLPEITGSSFSKAVLFSGNQCISTKIDSFSVRMG